MPFFGGSKCRETVPTRLRLWRKSPYCYHCAVLLDRHQAQVAQVKGDKDRPVAVLICGRCASVAGGNAGQSTQASSRDQL